MADTPNLILPYILAAQAQKHVTHNEAVRILDALVQLSVVDRSLSAPPASPTNGARYIVAASPTGAWSGHAAHIAAYQDGAWMFYPPRVGWLAWVADELLLVAWDGSAWVLASSGGGGGGGIANVVEDTTPQLGGQLDVNGFALGDGTLELLKFSETASAVNEVTVANAATGNGPTISATGDDTNVHLNLAGKGTGAVRAGLLAINGATADTTNRLAMTSPASLFNHAGAGHQAKINKNTAADTASFLFQTGFSGRAEMGTTGDDDFHFKVSPDGSAWFEAMKIDRSNGRVSFPSGGVRELLTANRTYFVRSDGNDSNNGLANTSGGAFLTIQRAIDTVGGLDVSIYNVTISVGAGTFTAALTLKNFVGAGRCSIIGAGSTTIISTTSVDAVTAVVLKSLWTVDAVKITTTTSGYGIVLTTGSALRLGNVDFGSMGSSAAHIYVASLSVLEVTSNYSITGNATYHIYCEYGGNVYWSSGRTVTLTGTPAFTIFAYVLNGGSMRAPSITFSGAATGKRAQVEMNGVIAETGTAVNGTYFPGNAAGTAATGGQFN